MTSDIDRCGSFYSRVFDWTPTTKDMGKFQYTTFKTAGVEMPVPGMMPITKEMGKMPPNWCTYMTVDDCDKAAEKAKKLGATMLCPPQDIPQVGRFCGITAPDGIALFMIKYTM